MIIAPMFGAPARRFRERNGDARRARRIEACRRHKTYSLGIADALRRWSICHCTCCWGNPEYWAARTLRPRRRRNLALERIYAREVPF